MAARASSDVPDWITPMLAKPLRRPAAHRPGKGVWLQRGRLPHQHVDRPRRHHGAHQPKRDQLPFIGN